MPSRNALRELKGKHVIVVGLARSGRMAIELLTWLGARVTAVDVKPLSEMGEIADQLMQQGISCHFGEESHSVLTTADLIVISPGVPLVSPSLDAARRVGIPIIAEIELAFPYLEGRLVGVTGTNGKSTTVTMAGAMLEQAGIPVWLGGNLGTPLSQIALDCLRRNNPLPEYLIVELSSFQLEAIDMFTPWLAVVLNITGDHMDRYSTFDDYVMAKARIFQRQGEEDYGLLNQDDSVVVKLGSSVLSSLMTFSRHQAVDSGMFVDQGYFMWRINCRTVEVSPLRELRLQGAHNAENAMAAASIGLLCGCSADAVRRVLQTFSGLEHACEHVRDRQGVAFINDSKATNVAATIGALESIGRPIVLIAGGRDKAADFSELSHAVRRYVKTVILIGESGQTIREVLEGADVDATPMYFEDSLEAAIRLASREADSGDVVLFSPACASFDMFQDYQHRGNQFKECVHALS
ncbi:MAG TPA: UDP-N-acetylmuramoyl-L-alanine--D-glutamate ligase [Nitrospirales bacterium]|nr:UDP-N-acetylmuramoyl-L-alanine--D-glutamate ligase [Nitrospirales bacterium]HIA13999.1 UDP-N-acetylmuramoyl-L-alanine--D-glutamate ligase [Nitrospirales bacterium]HIB54086.1 UDP-N-acetylmuramoyl-L-alanine--D-glutamate ligase [Nitrospirales bacterium]HIC05201.1 UDP-N-acetylmuramoyl-L-alanine--D-glutamate ligase [Nitrospirales bacterium]HIN33228.1 UDP-N-acetylmuramoyl-L-alanine--D-glutamate ligase [Nitrospirales bacterium]